MLRLRPVESRAACDVQFRNGLVSGCRALDCEGKVTLCAATAKCDCEMECYGNGLLARICKGIGYCGYERRHCVVTQSSEAARAASQRQSNTMYRNGKVVVSIATAGQSLAVVGVATAKQSSGRQRQSMDRLWRRLARWGRATAEKGKAEKCYGIEWSQRATR